MSSARFLLRAIAILGAFAPGIGSARGDDIVRIRLSCKVILNPANGARPAGVSDADVVGAIATANDLLTTYWRGYRFDLVDPVTDIGGAGGNNRPNPSHYYGVDLSADSTEADNLNTDAHNHKTQYAWNDSAINIFITNTPGSSLCHCGIGTPNEFVNISADSHALGRTYLHELGHFMGLCHTQGCGARNCADGDTTPGDDIIADTLPDVQCWTRDDIALNSYGQLYAALTPFRQTQVDNVFLNVMSYHGSYTGGSDGTQHARETELQVDRFADTASWTRTGVRDGVTVFVDATAGGIQIGTSVLPFDTVAEGLTLANSGRDIVLVRPGTYPENLTISDPVTLRAPRSGSARIGVP